MPCAGTLIASEDGNAIGKAMAIVRSQIKDLGLIWKICYCLTDNSATEQQAVNLPFQTVFIVVQSTCFASGIQVNS